MPLLLHATELTEQMRLHESIYCDNQLLLRAGKLLNAADIDFLKNRCPTAHISVEDPILDDLINYHATAENRGVVSAAQESLADVITDTRESYGMQMRQDFLDCGGLHQAVHGVLDFINDHPMFAKELVVPLRGHNFLVAHAVRTFYLSIMLGNDLRIQVAQAKRNAPPGKRVSTSLNLAPLGLAALYMDAAMWPMRDLYSKTDALTPEQCEVIRRHPITSAQMLPENTPELTKLIIETHHENMDGSGYPYGLQSTEIHIYSRILRIADAFVSATTPTAFRQATSLVRALWDMMWGPLNHFFDPVLLKIFARRMQPFPIGARLRLSNGMYGVVTSHVDGSPFLPEIVIAFDEHGKRLPASCIMGPMPLSSRPDLRIVSFGEDDLSDILDQRSVVQAPSADEFSVFHDSTLVAATEPSSN